MAFSYVRLLFYAIKIQTYKLSITVFSVLLEEDNTSLVFKNWLIFRVFFKGKKYTVRLKRNTEHVGGKLGIFALINKLRLIL